VGVAAGHDPAAIRVTGWAGLDGLPAWEPEPGLVLGLTSVSAETVTGGHQHEPNDQLFEALVRLQAQGHRVVVKRHPREQHPRWGRFELDENRSPASAMRRAACVVGVPGTASMSAAAMGVPFIALPTDGVPDFVWQVVRSVGSVDAAVAAVAEDRSRLIPSADVVDRVCGPIGGAAERIVAAWL
jgi:hypothetical protein